MKLLQKAWWPLIILKKNRQDIFVLYTVKYYWNDSKHNYLWSSHFNTWSICVSKKKNGYLILVKSWRISNVTSSGS